MTAIYLACVIAAPLVIRYLPAAPAVATLAVAVPDPLARCTPLVTPCSPAIEGVQTDDLR